MTAWKLAYHANCWGGLGGDAVGVTSVTQLAYRTFGDMDRACADIAAAGYAGVELFDGIAQMVHPDHIGPEDAAPPPEFEPVYPLSGRLTQGVVQKAVADQLEQVLQTTKEQ